ncbi:regulator SirB ['Osedax' symbiont bacterium Rs2_46_30_T18]|nr:regulator SirB ['Osedax' symbiont bacterium Rs2_46_30_T18]
MYIILKHSHLSLMLISVSLLIIRTLAVTVNAQWLQKKWAKILPHVIDTLLLLSAIALMITIEQYPGADHWLSAKIIALFGYITFGTLAIKGNKNAASRIGMLLIALSFIVYMMIVAISKNPMPWIS